MLLHILQHTPAWVFGLFIALVFLGYNQTKTRTLPAWRLTLLPIAMLGLSAAGVWSSVGASALGFSAWLIGISIIVASFAGLKYPKNIVYSPCKQRYSIPGSWAAFALIMLIFFTKYTVAVLLIRKSALHQSLFFTLGVCTFYGLSSGWFFARAVLALVFHSQKLAPRPS